MAEDTAVHSPSFCRADLLDRLDGDEELLREIVQVFLSEGPGRIEEIRTALQQGDASKIERSAHSMKGAAANISACRLREVTHDIESAARQGALALAASLKDALVREYCILSAELTKTIKGYWDNDG